MLERCAGRLGAQDSAIGLMPRPEDLDVAGLDIDPAVLVELTTVPPAALHREVADIRAYLKGYGAAAPAALYAELDEVERRLQPVAR